MSTALSTICALSMALNQRADELVPVDHNKTPRPHMGSTLTDECARWMNGTLGTFHNNDRFGIRFNMRGFTSQYGQDRTLWDRLFKNSTGPEFYYADVAANHYKHLSNTYFFDRCLGWSGVCVEPNPVYWAELRSKRSCHVVPHCVSNTTDEVNFRMGDNKFGVFGSIEGSGRFVNLWKESRPIERLRCIRTQSAFDEVHDMSHVHLMSLDVEGHEAAVLDGIDFGRMRIDAILCESGCERVLPRLGYVKTKHIIKDEWLWEKRDTL